jgi:hypothetical protein
VLVPVVDAACSGCALVQGTDGRIEATAVPSLAQSDTAFALLDFGGSAGLGGTVTVRDLISLPARQQVSGDIQVLQLLDVQSRVLYGLYIAAGDRTLHLSSPPGALRAQPIDVATGAVVPNDGSRGVAVNIAVLPNNNLSLAVNGAPVASVTDLSGAGTRKPRFLAAGIISASATTAAGPSDAVASVTVVHAGIAVASDAPGPPAPPSQASTPPPLATPVTPAQRSPAVSEAPELSGRAALHETLTATPGVWSDPGATITLLWERCDASGSNCRSTGAAGATYAIGDADVGSVLRVRATAGNQAGTGIAFSAPTAEIKAAPVAISAPSITGNPVEGATLTADPGVWSGADLGLSYAWQRCDASGGNCAAIAGQSGSTLVLGADDLGSTIAVAITAAGSGGETTGTSQPTRPVTAAPLVVPIPAGPRSLAAPSISGDALVGHTLSAEAGQWDDPTATFAYAWSRCRPDGTCTPVDGAVGSTYTLTQDDLGATLTVTVTATANATSTAVTSSPTQTIGADTPPTTTDAVPPVQPPTPAPPATPAPPSTPATPATTPPQPTESPPPGSPPAPGTPAPSQG